MATLYWKLYLAGVALLSVAGLNDPEDEPLGREVKGRELPPVGLEEPASAAATASAMDGERAAITPWTIEFSFLK